MLERKYVEHPALTRAAAGKPIGRRAVQALVKAYWPCLRQTDFAPRPDKSRTYAARASRSQARLTTGKRLLAGLLDRYGRAFWGAR